MTGRKKRNPRAEMSDERDLHAWLSHLETLHPRKIDLGLERVATVARRLGLLPVSPPVITVAGTNGKGTVVRCATDMLVAGGQRVGTYTSPHLMRYNERICIDGMPVCDDLIIAAFHAIDVARNEVSLSYFEFATLAALWIFRDQQVDIAVLEVGLGGRLDAVNIVDATVAVITRIALDHQQWLGDTLDRIAVEKAGIMRPGQSLVLAEAEYPQSLYARADDVSCSLQRAGAEWHWQKTDARCLSITFVDGQRLQLPLPPGLQPSNVAAAACAVSLAGVPVAAERMQHALESLVFPGRQQHVQSGAIEVILDVSHNPDAAAALARHLAELPEAPTFAIIGVLADKDLAGILDPVRPYLRGAMITGLPDTTRALSPQALAERCASSGLDVMGQAEEPRQAWNQVLPMLAPGSRLVVFGSFHTVGGIMPALLDSGVAGILEKTWMPL